MKKLILTLLSLAVVFSCKKDNTPSGQPDQPSGSKATVIRVSAATLSFEALSPESQKVKVFSDGSWTSTAPEWVTLNPNSGSGTVEVTVTVTENEALDGRVGEVVFGPELSSTTNKVSIQQKGNNKVIIKDGKALVQWLGSLNAESLDEAKLGADIDMSGITLVSAEAFSGIFDGDGHSIKNLTNAKGPLFKVNKGEIKNIVIDASCSFKPDSVVFGTIVARNEGIINDCINKANITREISNNVAEMRSNLVAGVVGMSTKAEETISGCKNYGNISLVVTDDGGFTTQGVAGVIALTAGSLSGCENYGDVSLNGGWHTGRACPARIGADGQPDPDGEITSGEIYTTKVSSSVGGVVGYVAGELTNCHNKGNVTWNEYKVEKITTSPARMFAGGVAGNYYGKVTGCTNEGVFTVKALSSDGSEVTSQNHQLAMGAVLGGFNNPANDAQSKNKGVDIENCSNKGKVILNASTSKSWIWLGGIVGYVNSDKYIPSGTMKNCSNTGDFEISGPSKYRIGGLCGVSPHMDGCTNKCTFTINGGNSDSAVGGLIGAHWGVKQKIVNSSTEAVFNSKAAIDLGGLTGDITKSADDSNNHSAIFEGCTVKATITQTGGLAGMLVGWSNADVVKVTMGTSTSPIEVSGTLNGTALTATSPVTTLWCNGYNADLVTMNYVVK